MRHAIAPKLRKIGCFNPNLAKVGVEGSNPFARSKTVYKIKCLFSSKKTGGRRSFWGSWGEAVERKLRKLSIVPEQWQLLRRSNLALRRRSKFQLKESVEQWGTLMSHSKQPLRIVPRGRDWHVRGEMDQKGKRGTGKV